jgi:hypothetical protein
MKEVEGAPADTSLGSARIFGRSRDELIRACRDAVDDGRVTEEEAATLLEWMRSQLGRLHEWPTRSILDRIRALLFDRSLDEDEVRELLVLLTLARQGRASRRTRRFDDELALPFERPATPIAFEGRAFSIAGRFYFGSHRQVCEAIEQLHGIVHREVQIGTDYLVVGAVSDRNWQRPSWRSSVLRAIEMNREKLVIEIVREQHWAEELARSAGSSRPVA